MFVFLFLCITVCILLLRFGRSGFPGPCLVEQIGILALSTEFFFVSFILISFIYYFLWGIVLLWICVMELESVCSQ